MLVLTRKVEQAITVGAQAEMVIKVLEINGNQVKLGITADRSVPIHREEIFSRILIDGQKKKD